MTSFLSCKANDAWSLPLFTYLHIYFIASTLLHISTLMCALNILDSKGINYYLICCGPISGVKPPCCDERRRYKGYPFSPVTVYSVSALGYLFVQRPFRIQGEFLFMMPHGPCTICVFTIVYSTGSSSGIGNSALINTSMSLGRFFSCSHRRVGACGSPQSATQRCT